MPGSECKYNCVFQSRRLPIMNELQRYLVEEAVEDYEEGRLSRREALKAIAGITGAMLATQILEPRAQAPTAKAPSGSAPLVAPNDADIVAGVAEFPGEGVGLAVDLLSREGGTAKHDFDVIPGILGKAAPARHVQDFKSGLAYARSQSSARGDRVGMTGFCFGGAVTWRVAAGVPDLRAAVPFYGVPVQEGEVPGIGAAMLAIYGGLDERINQNIPAIESAMQKHGKTFRKIVYPNVNHAFHNDTGDRYNAGAAKAAWSETLAWFGKYLA